MNEEVKQIPETTRGGKARKWKPGLRFNILVYLGVMMLMAVFLTSLVLFKITVATLTQLEVRRAESAIDSLQMSIAFLFDRDKDFQARNLGFLQAMANEIAETLNLERLIITLPDGKILARSFRKSSPGGSDPELGLAMKAKDRVVTLEQKGIGFWGSGVRELSVAVPIMRGNRVLGGIKATFSVAELDRNIRITQQLLLSFVGASTVLIMAFGVYYLSRTVIWPIRKLLSVTGEFAGGNLDARAELEEQNELGQLGRSFNEMAQSIRNNQRQLEENLHRLAEVNRDLKRARAELIYSEKMSTVGQLAQGVAHEIGNPLSAVLGYLEILNKSPNCKANERDLIARSEREIGRINEIIRELLHYSRPADGKPTTMDVGEIVGALVTLIEGQKRFFGIEIIQSVASDIPLVLADRNQLLQVLVNLAFNAADSMKDGGKLEVGAGSRAYTGPVTDNFVEAGDVAHQIAKGAPVVEVWLKDTGHGIAPETLERVFDPFFTTKDPGQGTGLGLAISSRILEAYHARLRIESTPQTETTCTITFPIGNAG